MAAIEVVIDQFWTFLVAITLLTLFPGVDSLLVVKNSGRGGWRDGVATSTGICSGLFVHALVSACGISALLLQSLLAFNILKLIGGGYLLWLGGSSLCQVFRDGHGRDACVAAAVTSPRQNFRLTRSLREGFISNVFNPKTLLFYMAFLPQFIDPHRSAVIQSLAMAATHFVVAMAYQSGLAVATVHLGRCFRNGPFARFAQGLGGLLLLGFGLRILLQKRI